MTKLLKSAPCVRNVIFREAWCRCPTVHPYRQSPTHVVTFLRHGESTWNAANLFTGWYDAPLTEKGIFEAQIAAKVLEREAMCFDVVFTSALKRAKDTVRHMFECGGNDEVRVVEDYRLNERHYGILTGFNKDLLVKEFGKEQVLLWRRGYAVVPPPMTDEHPFHSDIKATFPDIEVPRSESLKMTLKRSVDFWRSSIVPEIKAGRRVLIVSHNNALRAIIKYLDDISDDEIGTITFETGMPFTYTVDMYMKPLRNKRMQYLMRKEKPSQCKIR